jgi:hypothetical protein
VAATERAVKVPKPDFSSILVSIRISNLVSGLQPAFRAGFWTWCSESERGLKGVFAEGNRRLTAPLLTQEGWLRH